MNIEELAWSLRQMAPEFADSYCIINGELMKLDEVLRMGQEEYRTRSVRYMPSKLYKYFSNTYTENDINYSIQTLKDNTVHLEFPKNYDDVFDSEKNPLLHVVDTKPLIHIVERPVPQRFSRQNCTI